MTRWSEFPLRPQGQPWPGLNTRGGKLDPGQGHLEDGSFNAVINEADILEKRKGFVRGLDERFDGPVCGLFKYTSECGVEYVIVADQEGVHVRTPFNIPVFLGSDSLPNDDFEGELDGARWSPITEYQTFLGALELNVDSLNYTDEFVPSARLMQWFKPAAVTSYFVEIQYALVVGTTLQVVSIAMKRTGETYLIASVFLDDTVYKVRLQLLLSGVRTDLAESTMGGATLADGFLRLSFNSETRVATVVTTPSGGDIVTLNHTLTELQADSLGQDSAIGISREFSEGGEAQILQVIGGTI